jgi:hypothetical protein
MMAALVLVLATGFGALPGGSGSVPTLPQEGIGPQEGVGVTTDSLVVLARLRYEGGGDWYAGPSMLPNLAAALRDRTGLPVSQREVAVSPMDPLLRSHPFLFMTGHGNVRLSAEERTALREYLLSGGFLHADDNYGLDESFRREMALLFPDREMVELPPTHPIFRGPYPFPEGLPKIHEHDGKPPQAYGIFNGGRLMVLYTYETDLGNGWEDPGVHDNPPQAREQALRMGINIVFHVLSQVAP